MQPCIRVPRSDWMHKPRWPKLLAIKSLLMGEYSSSVMPQLPLSRLSLWVASTKGAAEAKRAETWAQDSGLVASKYAGWML
jgi:hypothetical protein